MPVQSLRRVERAHRPLALPPIVVPARASSSGTAVADRGAAATRCTRCSRSAASRRWRRDPCAVRPPVRLDRVVLLSALAGFLVLLTRTKRRSTSTPTMPLPAIAQPHRAAAADLQRGAAPRVGARCRRSTNRSRRPDTARMFDLFILSDTTDPDIWIAEENGFLRAARSGSAAAQHLLPPPAREHRAQGRQHRRLGARGSAPLRAHARARRRQPDDRRHASCASPPRWSASGRRH